MSESEFETPLHGDVNFRSANEVEVSIVAGCSDKDARVAKYVSVSVSLSKFETFLLSCDWNWRCFFIGRYSSDIPRKVIPVHRGSPYTASWVEE